MSNKSDKVPNDVKSFLSSVLTSSNGVKESRVPIDYHDLTGEKLMWKNYGFSSLNEFLNALPDVCVLQYSAKDRENRVYAVQKEGIYMSTHAKKNVKTVNTTVSDTKETNVSVVNGRLVQKDGDSFKITLSNSSPGGKEDHDDLIPNNDGLYQVYVTKLPEKCTEKDLKECFKAYGKVVEHQIVRSSIGKKIGFVRYSLKNDAIQALSAGKKNPPKIHGVELEIGKPKKKSNSSNSEPSVNSDPSEGSLSSTPSSPVKNTTLQAVTQESPSKNRVPPSPTHPTLKPTTNTQEMLTSNNPPFNTQTPLSVEVPTSPQHSTIAQATNTKNPWTLDSKSPTKTLLSLQPDSQTRLSDKEQQSKISQPGDKIDGGKLVKKPTFGVIISGYNDKLSEANLKQAVQAVGSLERFEFQKHYSTAWFKTKDEMSNAVSELNGKYICGHVLLVKPLTRNPAVLDEKSRRNVGREEKLPEFEDEFLKIYDFYSEAISRCCGQQYLTWLNNLPSIFEVKIMDLIDPCTFWAHLSDGSDTYLEFNELTKRLSFINESSDGNYLNKSEFGAGKYSDDGLWYRCYCREVSKDGRRRLVMYIDYGNTEWLQREKTVKLSDVFFNLRPQGVLVKLSGLAFKPNNDRSVNNSVLSSAINLLIVEPFSARKALVDSSKPFVLELELLHSRGETTMRELISLPGVETRPRQSSPVPPLLLSSPPAVPTTLKPIKTCLSDVNTPPHFIWITNIKSPTAFHFQLVQEESKVAIGRIQEMLLKCNIHNKVNVKDPKISGLVCYHKNGLERSRVTLINSSTTPGKVTVLHVDTGKEALVPLTSFIALPTEAKNIPFQARPAVMFGVPHDTLARSSEALEFMILQATKVIRAIIVKEYSDESVVVELFNSDGENVNKKLVEIANTETEVSNATPAQQIPSQSQETASKNRTLTAQNPAVSRDELAPVKSSGTNLVMSSQSQVSPSNSGQTLPPIQKQSSDQVSPNQTFIQGQTSPFQAFGQVQAKSGQAGVQNQTSPSQVFSQSSRTPNQSLTNNRTASTNRNFSPSQGSSNQAFGQNQPASHPAFTQNQAPSNRVLPPNHPSSQNQVPPNQALSHSLPNQIFAQKQSSHQDQISPNQNIASNQPRHKQVFAQNQGFSPSQLSSQNQASPTQAFPKQSSAEGQISPSSRPLQHQAPAQSQGKPHLALPGQKPAPNETLNQASTNQAQNRPQHNQTFPRTRVLPNPVPPQNQVQTNQSSPQNITQSRVAPSQGQPATARNFIGPDNRLTNTMDNASNIFAQRPVPQHDHTDPGPPLPNSRFYDSRRAITSQKDVNSKNHDVTSANVGTTPQGVASKHVTSQPTTSQRYASQARAPKGFASSDTISQDTKSAAATPQAITSQAVASQVPTSQSFTSQLSTSQAGTAHSVSSLVPSSHGMTTHTIALHGLTSQDVTSQTSTSQVFSSHGAPKQIATSQSSASRSITSQRSSSHGATSPSTTSQSITSKGSSSLTGTSEKLTSQGSTSSLTQFGKTRSDSSTSTESKNSLNSEESWDQSDTNIEHEAKTSSDSVHEVRSKSPHETAGSDRKGSPSPTDVSRTHSSNKLHSTKPRSPTTRKKPFRNSRSNSETKFKSSVGLGKNAEKRSKPFNLTESGASKIGLSAESYARSFPGKGGKESLLPAPGVSPLSRQAIPSPNAGSVVRMNSRKMRDVRERVTEQDKMLSYSGKELQSKVEMYKKHEKLEMEYRIKVLENENLILEAEIKKNLDEKAKLERQLQR